MQLREIARHVFALEGASPEPGDRLGDPPTDLDCNPAATCVYAGVLVEHLLRDLWKRLKLRGPPHRRQLEELLTQTTRKLEEDGNPIPGRVHDDVRALQLKRNRAAHHWEATREDAEDCLR
jgi:hypothetical protein